MEMIQTQEKGMFVDRKPTANAFFATLAETSKIQTPHQIFRAQIRIVEKAAEAGDIRGWQENSAPLATLASAAGIDMQDLEIRVQLKKIELSLLMNAQKKASTQAKGLEKQATELQIAGDVNAAKDLFAKAQKLIALSLQLKGQLEARLA